MDSSDRKKMSRSLQQSFIFLKQTQGDCERERWERSEGNPSLGNLRKEELCALCSPGHAKMQFGDCPGLHWKVMVFTELSYDQLFTDSL